jgi:inhibitor of KinA
MTEWFELAEDVVIFNVRVSPQIIGRIKTIEWVLDVVVTDHELAIQHTASDISALVDRLLPYFDVSLHKPEVPTFEVPVCYELGLDWDELEKSVGLYRNEIQRLHASAYFEVSYGYTPGFLYLTGLPERLKCPRKPTPRRQVPKGAVGIGGAKSGIYALDAPGGWQIIGRTPMELFDRDKNPPVPIPFGARVRFKAISKEEFLAYDSI